MSVLLGGLSMSNVAVGTHYLGFLPEWDDPEVTVA
jgi:hypothetical protein